MDTEFHPRKSSYRARSLIGNFGQVEELRRELSKAYEEEDRQVRPQV